MSQRAELMLRWLEATWVHRLVLTGLLAACVMMALGGAWDAHWHAAIGRDSIWIPPHMLMYIGAALASAIVAFIALRMAASARPIDPLGIIQDLRAQGYGTVTAGAALLTGAAVFDDIWHRTIGDTTIWCPPHVLAAIGSITIGLGTMVAVLRACQQQILPSRWGQVSMVGVLAGVLIAAFFGLLPAGIMAFHPEGVGYRFFTSQDPYFVAILAALMIPALVTASKEVLGRWGFEIVASAGVTLWMLQEAFHLLLTPVVAGAYGYVMVPFPVPDVHFEVIFLFFVLVPALIVNLLAPGRPLWPGVLAALLYVAAVAIWQRGLGLDARPAALMILVSGSLGILSTASGAFFGARIRQMSAQPTRTS